MSTQVIFHIAHQQHIARLKQTGFYSAESLQSEGFIHCCDQNQLSGVLQRYYEGVDDLVLLSIDTAKLTAPLIYENTTGGAESFPHVYGFINVEAVIRIDDFGLQSPERLSRSG